MRRFVACGRMAAPLSDMLEREREMRPFHRERHRTDRVGWLRAAVLGANDGTISTASLVVGVAVAGSSQSEVLITGTAGLIAGAMAMAAGEYVSVESQAETERADVERERRELSSQPGPELTELTAIYIERGLDEPLARQVAEKLTIHDALGSHVRDELGLTEALRARPLQAAASSALCFICGGAVPLLSAAVSPPTAVSWVVFGVASLTLATMGAMAALAGGAPVLKASLRVAFSGMMAMAVTAAAGRLVGAAL